MGSLISKEKMRVIFVGPDAAGKTTILYQIKNGLKKDTRPTIGYNMEKIVVSLNQNYSQISVYLLNKSR